MENLTGGTPPVRYLLCVVPCKLYFVSCDGTEYRNVITTEDEKGNPKEVGSPYTNYTIQVLENIKGELITDKPIPIVKQGGISEKQDAIYLFENDSLPSENSIYIFWHMHKRMVRY